MGKFKLAGILLILFLVIIIWIIFIQPPNKVEKESYSELISWKAPDTSSIPDSPKGNLIRYGRELILHTGMYFGPKGIISKNANGMNCENCHLYGGTKFFGNNFSLAATSYPKFRNRSGKIETIVDRVNGCMERSMNGSPLDSVSKEMIAIVAYMNWIGKDVSGTKKVLGSGLEELPWLTRAADPAKGRKIYVMKCARCHGNDGQGVLKADSTEYIFPPLWGKNSYNIGAGIYRISKFAAFVKNNMPFGATHNFPLISNNEAWDVAAFVNSQPHPFTDCQQDWPEIISKPVDYPFGPYPDSFSEKQHKYGPFPKMIEYAKK